MGCLILDQDFISTLAQDYLVNLFILLPEGSSIWDLISCELIYDRTFMTTDTLFTTLELLKFITEPIKKEELDIGHIEEGGDELLLRTLTAVTQTPGNRIRTIRMWLKNGVELPQIPGFNLVLLDFDTWSNINRAHYHVVRLLSGSISTFLRFCFKPEIGQ